MRVFLLVVVVIFLLQSVHGQDNTLSSEQLPRFYIGVGTGISNITGILGVSGTLRLTDKFNIRGAAGLGMWGAKYTIGLKYNKYYEKGWSYGISYSHYTGIKKLETVLELESGNSEKVIMDFNPTETINLTMAYSWKIGRKNNFYLEYGYAIATESKPWIVTYGSNLSSNAKTVLNILRPGGIIIGAGFNFGL